jgi:hypothetical protein
MSTTTVESTSSLYFLSPLIFGSDSQGHEAFLSSPVTSLMNLEMFTVKKGNEMKGQKRLQWHGGRDLNPQHSVLETDALPIELPPC